MATFLWTAFMVVIGDGTFSTTPVEDWAKRGRKGKVIGQDDHRKLVRLLTSENAQLTFGAANASGLAGLVDAPMTKGAYELLRAITVQPIQHRRKFEAQAAKHAYQSAVLDKVDAAPLSVKRRIFC